MKRFFLIIILFQISWLSFSQENLAFIPKPHQIDYHDGFFELNSETVIQADEDSFEAKYLQQIIKNQLGLNLEISTSSKADSKIVFLSKIIEIEKSFKEWYNLSISKNKIIINSTTSQGAFYGVQTLIQLLPLENIRGIKIQCLNITDEPKFQWRGMHLDVSRHFFSKEFIKKYIDYLAIYKMNTFHWHLTDDQGWRIEIKKYPKLTEVGAWRNGSMIGHYTDQTFDNIPYGGFYTQDEIKEIVAYAKERHITIIPEIEMPGHALAALASYPEFSCNGGPFEVGKTWGVLEDVFCPKDETFTFLENILTEVMELFPSEYIHIGGDESPKVRWKSCPHCQKRIKDENLKDEHELQSYFIQRIEKFVNSKGRKIIGWDEILEGGLAPNAAVMSWRGTEGGIAAAKQKHFVVMSPGSHCYFDHYQGEPKNEPIAFGGYTNVEKVYSFNPISKELSTEESKYILGAQANLWTEYINTPEHAEYMLFPRIAALSEVVWGTSNSKEYKEFEKRLISHFEIYDKKGINYSKAIFEVTSKVQPAENGVAFELKSANPNGIKYTTDGSEPNVNSIPYEKPILVTKSQTIKAAYFENGKAKSATIEQPFFITKSTGKEIELVHQPHENYGIGGSFTLVDGMKGNSSKFGRDWLGFWGDDLEATINLGINTTISKIGINTLLSEGSWIYFPKEIKFFTSIDGVNFQIVKSISQNEIITAKGKIIIEFPKRKTKFIKVIAKNNGIIADGKPGAGSKSWLFVDEISVEL
ncbi:glycoside hydrolase family 20 protein [Flavobacterium okayamense]|uniref:beta-N-acetylhexosaminidase n=1 Tax=Flavobacterium okayamense TaxID=2830782 RepID=A0ABM7S1G8_9FLAO|nr:glycoside hydrolase family 20 protein [Flavobacterium okayamense]BCY27457.1 beta-N-acetylhexosaminidase [Flavobacterium okayamense]